MSRPVRMIAIGFLLEVVGFALPFLMVLGVLPASFLLSFISFGASIVGLFLGLYGASLYTISRRSSWRDYFQREE